MYSKNRIEHSDISPLVSIVVITYNSSKTVVETLESAKNQSYKNIELVVSDDYSLDNTVQICKNWIEDNKEHFTTARIITSKKNTGIAPNCNRGVKASQGIWVKAIAGDDILQPEAIKEFVRFVEVNNYEICCSKLKLFGENQATIKKNILIYNTYFKKMSLPIEKQKRLIREEIYIPGPGIFFSRRLYDAVGGFDERFPMAEEWPFYLKIFEQGYHIPVIDMDLVRYRVSEVSACRGNEFGSSIGVLESTKNFFFRERRKILLKHFMLLVAWHQTINYWYMFKIYSNKSKLEQYLVKSLFIIDPLRIINRIKKKH